MANETALLAERAARLRQSVLEVACGPGGMIIAFPRFDTRRPFQEGEEPPPYLRHSLDGGWGGNAPQPTIAEWLYGENTLWATGWFLWSQILRYRATQELEALETARKCFRDLNNIFRICRPIEPGLLGKPHGGRAGMTTSYDQAASPVLFYVTYAQEMATAEEKAQAVENMALHGDYFLRRNWVVNQHGHLSRIVAPLHTSSMKYFACVYAAYELTGETRFRDAVLTSMRQLIQEGKLPWPSNPYEINHNLHYYAELCDYWMRTELVDDIDWVGCIRAYWQAAQRAMDAEGLALTGQYDHKAMAFTPYADIWVDTKTGQQMGLTDTQTTGQRWVSATAFFNRAFDSAGMAALALLARAHGLDDQAQ